MDGSSKEIFRALAEIQRARQKPLSAESAAELVNLIESRTLDYRLRDAIANQYGLRPDTAWSDKIRNEQTALLCRSDDPVYLGNTNVLLGRYHEAMPFYNASEHKLFLASNLQVLLGNWPYVITLCEGTKAEPLNLALAYWCTGEFAKCLETLLTLGISEESIWLSDANICAMLFACSFLCLDAEDRQFFLDADPLAERYRVPRPDPFWSTVKKLEFPFCAPLGPVLEALRVHRGQEWLNLHSKVSISTAQEELGDDNYSLENLYDDLRKWGTHELDLVNNCVVLRTPQRSKEIEDMEVHQLATSLAFECKRDALVTKWAEFRQQ